MNALLSLLVLLISFAPIYPASLAALHQKYCSLNNATTILAAFDISKKGMTGPEDYPNIYGPQSPHICVVTYLTPDILSYAQHTMLINALYSSLSGYNFYAMHPGNTQHMGLDDFDTRWNKVKLLYDAIQLDGWGNHCDYVMWVDADWIVVDMKWNIQSIISSNPLANLIVSAEHAGSTTRMNSGSILVRNCAWSRSFLWDWWTIADRKMLSDQEQFDMLYQQRLDSFSTQDKEKIAILPPEAMNSDPPAMTNLQASHQVLHLMGEENEYREKVFQQAWRSICHTLSNSQIFNLMDNEMYINTLLSNLSHQLSVPQPVLLGFTLDIYGKYLQKDFKLFSGCISSNSSDINMNEKCQILHSLEQCRRLSNLVHHYVHALEHTNNATNLQTAVSMLSILLEDPRNSNVTSDLREYSIRLGQTLRWRLYQYLNYNLHLWQHTYNISDTWAHDATNANAKHVPRDYLVPRDYPELLKTVAIAGQHLLPASFEPTIPLLQRIAIADEIESLLNRMMLYADRRQHPAIQQMAIHHLLQEGEMALSELSQVEVAEECFSRAVALGMELIPTFGTHHMIQPLIMLANVQAIKGKFKGAAGYYEDALRIARETFGPWHLSLGKVYYNYACACKEAGEKNKAGQLLSNVNAILLMHSDGVENGNDVSYLSSKVSILQKELDALP